jgi:hypothetical protein
MSVTDFVEYVAIFLVVGIPAFLFAYWLSRALERRYRGRF